MPVVSRTFDTRKEAEDWIDEVKEADIVTASRIEETGDGKFKAIVTTE